MIDISLHCLGPTFIPYPKNFNQTRLGLKFQIKRKPYTKRILIIKENIKLSPITDRDTAMNQSATFALFFRVIGRLPIYSHRQTPALVIDTNTLPLLDLVISGCFPSATTFIGNSPADWSPLLHLPIYIPLTPDAYQKIRVQKRCQQRPKWFLRLCCIRRKPCTYLAPKLRLFLNRPKRDSI